MNINFNIANPNAFGTQGANCCSPMGGGMNPMQGGQQMQMMMQMMQVMMQILGQMMGGAGAVPTGGGFGGGGMGGGTNGIGNFLGGGGGGTPSFGGAAPSGGAASSAAVNPGTPGASGTGQAAVDLARKYIGRDSIGLKGDMPHFTAAGGVTNNCVDFVSSALESQGLVKGHHINVRSFEKELQKQGWRQIPVNQAQPGDVWINHSRGHTELVATPGAKTLIGSNGSARQKVSEHNNDPSSGVIYAKR